MRATNLIIIIIINKLHYIVFLAIDAIVCWDSGTMANYRITDGTFDLRVYDNAQLGKIPAKKVIKS